MKKMTLLTALVAAVAITAYSVSGTYAKYTSTTEGTANARVAKWNISNTQNGTQMAQNFDFDLFETILDSDETQAINEDDIATATDKIIAPGTRGEFSMDFWNNSEVNATLAVNWTVTNANNIPVEYRGTFTYWDATKNDYTSAVIDWTKNINDIKIADSYKMLMGKSATLKVEWRWAFENANDSSANLADNDTYDTNLGLDGNATLSVNAKVTATQID